ncbi:MAG: TIGR01459 family HAD-type hydrolase [Rhodovibrionaceae bacterium]
MASVPLYDGLAALASRYDGFICDLWGVLHDGVTAFPEAIACLQHLRTAGKKVAILSNAPRRAAEVRDSAARLGIRPELHNGVVSSGEAAWQHLKHRPDAFYKSLGRSCVHIGPERDHGMRDGLDLEFVAAAGEADFLLNTGAHLAKDTPEAYAELLEDGAARGLPMVCANPDLEVIRGGKREICAGALAQRYEELGGEVRYHGKPHAEIYEACFVALEGIARENILAVGDSLRTDIAGAQAAGVDSLFIAGGIHAESLDLHGSDAGDAGLLNALFAARETYPSAAMRSFLW